MQVGFSPNSPSLEPSPQRVLLVEDNDDDAAFFRSCLEEAGAADTFVAAVPSLSAALAALEAGNYDVVVFDLSLPDSSGLAGVEELQRHFPALPLVVLSASGDKELALQAVRGGAQDFLLKGTFSPELLVRALQYAVERKTLLERIEYEATHDCLTNILNRHKILQHLAAAVERANRYGEELTVCLCDIDGFKDTNDTHGHLVGDRVLAGFGKYIQDSMRLTDFAGRYGGDEFLMLFIHTPMHQARIAVERIRDGLQALSVTLPDGSQLKISASFGLAGFSMKGTTCTDLLGAADQALYQGKSNGKDCVVQAPSVSLGLT